jgi:hypothetical protein
MIHQLYVELTGPASQEARFSTLLVAARSNDRVNLTLMTALASATSRVHPDADDIVNPGLDVPVGNATVIGRRCVGPLRVRSSKSEVTAYYLDADDDCDDEFRSLTDVLPGLRVQVTARTRHDDCVLFATHVYWSGKRRLLQYDKRSGRHPALGAAASSPLPREVTDLLQSLGKHRSDALA